MTTLGNPYLPVDSYAEDVLRDIPQVHVICLLRYDSYLSYWTFPETGRYISQLYHRCFFLFRRKKITVNGQNKSSISYDTNLHELEYFPVLVWEPIVFLCFSITKLVGKGNKIREQIFVHLPKRTRCINKLSVHLTVASGITSVRWDSIQITGEDVQLQGTEISCPSSVFRIMLSVLGNRKQIQWIHENHQESCQMFTTSCIQLLLISSLWGFW